VQLQQVLLNLVVNARDADATRITLATRRIQLDVAHAADHPGLEPGPYVAMTVEDDGHGMSEEVAAHAFDPFFTTKSFAHGTGLGLATVYGIVQRCHGFVSLRSAPRHGTVVEVLLPVTEAEEPVLESLPPAEAHGGNATVLLVEDEPGVRDAVRRILERNGYEVVEAANGDAALAAATGQHIDVLLSDVIMPGVLSGPDVAALLCDVHPELRVVFMTGYGADKLDDKGIVELHGEVLTKPFAEGELLSALGRALGAPERVTAAR